MRVQAIKDVEKIFLEPSFNYLVKNGLENTSVRDLCKAMGISSGSIYYWFEDKEDIYTSVMQYGINKVAGALFDDLFKKIHDPKLFFDTYLDEIDKYSAELRLVFQATTSPMYGEDMRKKGNDFKGVYDEYVKQLADILNCEPDVLKPVIYMLVTILVDYVIWEDRETSEMLLEDLYETMMVKLEKAKKEN